ARPIRGVLLDDEPGVDVASMRPEVPEEVLGVVMSVVAAVHQHPGVPEDSGEGPAGRQPLQAPCAPAGESGRGPSACRAAVDATTFARPRAERGCILPI